MTRRNARNDRKTQGGSQPWGERLDKRTLLSGITAIVTTTKDTPGFVGVTLREAILEVNANPSPANSIIFEILKSDPGYNRANGTFTISLTSELPQITSPVLIDGTTESAFIGGPALVVIDGAEIKGPADGLTLAPSAPASTIDGLEIENFDGSGIVTESSRNTIGGTASRAGNILASNTTAGILTAEGVLIPSESIDNLLLGNLIGTDASGANLGNGAGVIIHTSGNTIGGTTPAAANVIGFNTSEGILISGTTASDNVVLGNLIGTNATGANLGNPIGVSLETGSNTIGGTSPGSANVFGFNSTAGLEINGAGATNEFVAGNLFGTNASGADVGNVVGVLLQTGNNTIGGTSSSAANVFGFNTNAGLLIRAADDVVSGNLFGTNASGANLGNVNGANVQGANNTIGGTSTVAANIFGFNSSTGIELLGATATDNVVLGNFLGTDSVGHNLANAIGVLIGSAGNTVGGTTPGSANDISQNSTAGVEITGAGAAANVVLGDMIGTDGTGQLALGNGIGVLINGGAGNVIGGTTSGAGNVISGNVTAGIELESGSVTATQILGNRIGTNPSGTSALVRANQPDLLLALQNAGVVIIGSTANTVGGTSPQAANVISGNYVGVMLATIAGSSTPNQVSGNLIGTDASGSNALGNIVGIYINGASGNEIGGTAPGSANTVSGNTSVGVEIYGSGSTANLVAGNVIGLAADGSGALRKSNGQFVQPTGVFILNASGNTIGGSTSAARNVISGNQNAGVYIFSQAGVSSGNIVKRNLIGLASGGSRGPGNNGYGVLFLNSAKNQVGLKGSAANRFGRNRIANFRSLSRPPGAIPATAAKSRSTHDAGAGGSHHLLGRPAGPARHRMRRFAR
jgi:large repetitive protein